MLARPFEDDHDEEGDLGAVEEPEYSFEGFEIEFSERIMLTPVAPAARGKAAA